MAALQGQALAEAPALRASALASMGPASDASHAGRLLVALNDPDHAVRTTAIQQLQQSPVRPVADALLDVVGPDFNLQPEWSAAMAPLATSELEGRLVATLADPAERPTRRAAAARALALLRRTGAVQALGAALWDGRQPVAQAALDALFFLRATEAIPQWLALVDHPDPQVAATAVRALADLGGPAANALLMAIALGERPADSTMQAAALRGIDAWPGAQAVPAMVSVMEANPELRMPVGRILRERTGLELGPDPAVWRAWLAGELQQHTEDGVEPEWMQPTGGDPAQDALPFSVQFTP